MSKFSTLTYGFSSDVWRTNNDVYTLTLQQHGMGQHHLNVVADTDCCRGKFRALKGSTTTELDPLVPIGNVWHIAYMIFNDMTCRQTWLINCVPCPTVNELDAEITHNLRLIVECWVRRERLIIPCVSVGHELMCCLWTYKLFSKLYVSCISNNSVSKFFALFSTCETFIASSGIAYGFYTY